MKHYTFVDNIHIEGTVSQIFDIGPSLNIVVKNLIVTNYYNQLYSKHPQEMP